MKTALRMSVLAAVFLTAPALAGTTSAATITYTGNVLAENNLITVSFPDIVAGRPWDMTVRMEVSADFTCRAGPVNSPGQPGYCGQQAAFGGFTIDGGLSVFSTPPGTPGVSIQNQVPGDQFPVQNATVLLDTGHNTISIRTRLDTFSSPPVDFPVTLALFMSFDNLALGEPVFLAGGRNVPGPNSVPLPAALPLMAAALSGLAMLKRAKLTTPAA